MQVLIAGLLGNLIRFLYISFITWPWLVLPFEFLQGTYICHILYGLEMLIRHSETFSINLIKTGPDPDYVEIRIPELFCRLELKSASFDIEFQMLSSLAL